MDYLNVISPHQNEFKHLKIDSSDLWNALHVRAYYFDSPVR